ncbi:hypothetical protein SAMN05880570_2216 [Paenibacillus sp. RU4T]|nr:hypothetical protein SAMN05880555_2217 [Paenibacillus sp. RU4X]SIQ96734.1 hypothetical protein SAMN05880570_2216 [Paenibacillus sp. RU4T]
MKRASIPSHPHSPSRSQGRSGRHSRPFYRKPWLVAVLALLILYAGVVVYQTHKPLPPGVSFEGTVHYVPDGSLELLTDLTHRDAGGGQQSEQQIFERMFRAIGNARQFIVLDMFLYNGYANKGQSYPPLSRKMTDKLIEQKKRYPELAAVVITDDVNTSYGSHDDPELELLKRAGIQVSITNVNPLRDSNPLYTAAWRMTAGWFGQHGKGWLPNKMASEAPDMTVRSYLKLVNAKANHRKVLITENELVLASANAHDSSFYNSNSGYAVSGSSGLIGEALRTEQAALDLSKAGIRLPDAPPPAAAESAAQGTIGVQLLTEGKIRKHVLADLKEAGAGDTVWMGMFYLADRSVVRALLDARRRNPAHPGPERSRLRQRQDRHSEPSRGAGACGQVGREHPDPLVQHGQGAVSCQGDAHRRSGRRGHPQRLRQLHGPQSRRPEPGVESENNSPVRKPCGDGCGGVFPAALVQ